MELFNASEVMKHGNIGEKEWNVRTNYAMITVLSMAYASIFIAGLIGNTAVLLVVLRNRHMRSVTNIFICNLSVADLLSTIFVAPLTLLQNIFIDWHWGATACWCVPYLQGISVCASSLTLLVIAIDRYLAICFPMKRLIQRSLAKKLIAVIWIISSILFVPWAVHFKLIDTNGLSVCHEIWPSVEAERFFFLGIVTLLVYTAPLLFMAFCYFSIIMRVWDRYRNGSLANETNAEVRRLRDPPTKLVNENSNCVDKEASTGSYQPPNQDLKNGRCPFSLRKRYSKNTNSSGVDERKDKSKHVRLQSVGGLNRVKTVKIVKMLSVVVVNFCLCWLPLFTIFNIIKFSTIYSTDADESHKNIISINDLLPINFTNMPLSPMVPVNFSSHGAVSKDYLPTIPMTALTFIVPFAQLLGSANSCVNPWIYCFYSKTYRRGFRKVFQCKSGKQRPRFNRNMYLRENTWTMHADLRNNRSVKVDHLI